MNMCKHTLVAGLICFAGLVSAQTRLIEVDSSKMPTTYAVAASELDASGNPAHWVSLNQGGVEKDAASWQMAWDSLSTNPVTLQALNGNPYGVASPGVRRLDSQAYRRYMWLEDMSPNPAAAGKIAQHARIALFLNPAGTATASGTSSLFVRVSTVPKVDDTTFGPAFSNRVTSVGLLYPTLAAGNQYLAINLEGTGLGLPVPENGGGVLVEVGTIGLGNTFKQLSLPFSVQPLLSNMLSPGEPKFPGTNPSKSTEFNWCDDTDVFFIGVNQPNYIFEDFTNTENSGGNTYAEQYSWDTSLLGQQFGILQASMSFFVDANARTIQGQLNLEDRSPTGNSPSVLEIQFRDRISGSVISSTTTLLRADRTFTVLDPRQTTGGDYTMFVKTSHWLRKAVNVDSRGGSVTGVSASLLNGDCDGSNDVGTDDYLILNSAFDTVPGDMAWDVRADLDESGSVGTDDYLILNKNFDTSGD